jgi:hypothetical protein
VFARSSIHRACNLQHATERRFQWKTLRAAAICALMSTLRMEVFGFFFSIAASAFEPPLAPGARFRFFVQIAYQRRQQTGRLMRASWSRTSCRRRLVAQSTATPRGIAATAAKASHTAHIAATEPLIAAMLRQFHRDIVSPPRVRAAPFWRKRELSTTWMFGE